MDLVKFQLTYKILFYGLAAVLELLFCLYYVTCPVIQGVDLYFPLNRMLAVPLTCRDCISLWSVYILFFAIVMISIRSVKAQRAPLAKAKISRKGAVDETMEILPSTPSSLDDKQD
jgi:hypothetical protein